MFPEPDEDGNGLPAVQYAALMADLVMKTKQTLASLFPEQGGQFTHLRLRTKQDTELIITDISRENNEYILCAIQNCKFEKEVEEEEEVVEPLQQPMTSVTSVPCRSPFRKG